jgi:hypothetical protein
MPQEDNASETELRVPEIKGDESHGEHQHADKQQIIIAEETVPRSEQLLVNGLRSENTKNIVYNQDQFTDYQSAAKDAVSDTGHPSIKCQQATNTVGSMSRVDNQSADNKQVENNKEQSSPTDISKTTVNIVDNMPNKQVANTKVQSSSTDELKNVAELVDDFSDEVMTDNHCNGTTNGVTVQIVHSDVPTETSELEIVETNKTAVTL